MSAYGLDQFLKTASNTVIDDFSAFLGFATAPARIAGNHVQAIMLDLDINSQRRIEKSRDRARIYKKFIGFKNHFATSPDRNGKYVYHFLCGVETLAPRQSEQLVFSVTAFIDADPELAISQIGESMRKLSETGMLNLTNRQTLALGN